MLYPTIEELTQGKYNRYELALATASCARLVTNEYVRQHEAAEKSLTGNKETDRPINTMIDRELRDEKAVKVAIGRLHSGAYVIDPHANEHKDEEIDQTVTVREEPISLAELFAGADDDEEEEDEELSADAE